MSKPFEELSKEEQKRIQQDALKAIKPEIKKLQEEAKKKKVEEEEKKD